MSSAVDDIESARQKALEERFEREAEAQRKKREQDKANAAKNNEEQDKEARQQQQQQQPPSVLKPTNVLEEADKGIFFSKDKYPQYNNDEYTRYLSYQRGKRQKWIAEEYSKQEKYIIPLYQNQNNGGPGADDDDPLLDPDKPFTNDDAEHIKSVGIEQKEFDFHDASVKHFHVMQDLDNQYSQSIQDIQHAILNAPRGGIAGDEFMRLSENLRKAEEKRYRYGARLFLRMTDDEYNRAVNLQNIKDAVDAAIHRTAHTIPNYTKSR